MALQERRELVHECVVAQLEAARLVRVAVIGDDGRDGGEEAGRGRDQRLGDARGDHRKRRLLRVPESLEGAHDAPHRSEEADVGARRPDSRERRKARLEPVDFAELSDAHRAPHALEQLSRRHGLAAQAREFAEACLENALQPNRGLVARPDLAIQLPEVAARPERAFKPVRFRLGQREQAPLAEND